MCSRVVNQSVNKVVVGFWTLSPPHSVTSVPPNSAIGKLVYQCNLFSMRLLVYGMSVKVNSIYYVHVCEQVR